MSKSSQSKNKPRLSVDMSNMVLSKAVTQMEAKFKISRTKAVEILAIEGWKALGGKPEPSLSQSNGIEYDEKELASHNKILSTLKINLIKSCGIDTLSDVHSGIPKTVTIKPVKYSVTIESWVLRDSVYLSGKRVDYKLIKKIIKENIGVHAPTFATFFSFYPGAVLCFLTRADVSFHSELEHYNDVKNTTTPLSALSENHFLMKVKVSVACVPVYKTQSIAKITSLLDFDGIAYKTFKNVATQGWNRNLYSHYFYIEDANLYRSGGYFIGVTREPCQSHFDQQSGYSPSTFTTDKFGAQIIVPMKFFQEGMSIKITQSSLNMVKKKILADKIKQQKN